MRKSPRRLFAMLAVAVVLLFSMSTTAMAAEDPTEAAGSKMIECADCGTTGLCMTCYGQDEACEACGGTFLCPACGGEGYVESPSHFYNTFWALLPPIIAIALALITKEVYSSCSSASWPAVCSMPTLASRGRCAMCSWTGSCRRWPTPTTWAS